MGLTIHYGLTSRTRSTAKAKNLVERMRQLALDLPFESVDEQGPVLRPRRVPTASGRSTPRRALVLRRPGRLQARPHSLAPQTVWQHHASSRWKSFRSGRFPALVQEWASFGLARYPAEIEVTYCPMDDDRFIKTIKNGGSTRWEFDWKRWGRWLKRNGHEPLGCSRRREVPGETEDQDRARLDLAILDLLQDPVCKRRAVRRHPQLRPLPPVRDPPARPDRPSCRR